MIMKYYDIFSFNDRNELYIVAVFAIYFLILFNEIFF